MNNTNEKIRYIAFKCFLEGGYSSTNIRDLCKMVGIKSSSLYFYYKSKEELFLSIYDEIWKNKIEFTKELVDGYKFIVLPASTRLEQFTCRLIDYYAENLLNEKFLLRYHLFPSTEVSHSTKDKFLFWTNEENKLLKDLIFDCLKEEYLNKDININVYLHQYKEFLLTNIIDMLIYNIRKNKKELEASWKVFWNGFTNI